MEKKTREETTAYAAKLWAMFDANEKFGVRFGMFPARLMDAADKDGFGHALTVALMDCAKNDGGMRA